jgi:hypothetical protein
MMFKVAAIAIFSLLSALLVLFLFASLKWVLLVLFAIITAFCLGLTIGKFCKV